MAHRRYNGAAVQLAARLGVPVVATNDARFLDASEFESHEARVCIHDGQLLADPSRTRKYTAQQYLRTPDGPERVALAGSEVFDPRLMRELYELGLASAAAGPVWSTAPPGFDLWSTR